LLAAVIGSTGLAAGEHAVAQEVPLVIAAPAVGVTSYLELIPLPEEVIGHRIGTAHSEPSQIVAYVDAIAEVSDRVVAGRHGRTYEGRPLVHAVITSPANHARLDDIRRVNLSISESPESLDPAALESMPVIVWLGYSVHGNEASGSDAAMLVLYHLAAGQGADLEEWLSRTVVLLVPDLNPDGRNRFTGWVNANRGAVPVTDAQDREHREPWPGGRTNHYWFDLNRDWLPAQAPETIGRLELFHSWRPQVLTDHHEMGSESTFFFQPGVPSRTNPITPEQNQELTDRIARFHARALDRVGQLYFSRESFDDFYYGKGSTYPDVNGAVGILFEQASSRALNRQTASGDLSYALTIRNQFITSLSTLEAVVALRVDLLTYQRDFYFGATAFVRDQDVEGYVVSLAEGRTRAQELARLLRRHRIRLYELAEDTRAGGRDFRRGEAYVVPLDQPQARLIRAAMERRTVFSDSLFYDVSAWTLPLAFDVDHEGVDQLSAGMLGREITDIVLDGGTINGGRATFAYVLEWTRFRAPAALFSLLADGALARVVHSPFTVSVDGVERELGAGSIVIPVVQPRLSPEEVHRLIETAVTSYQVEVTALSTGLTSAGPDLGGASTTVLKRPAVGLLVGAGSSSNRAGEVWHLLSERAGLPVSLLSTTDLAELDLSAYDLLILPDGSYDLIDAERLGEWVRAGGRLVALGSAIGWLVESELVEVEEIPFSMDSLVAGKSYEDATAARGAQAVSGAILVTELDSTHPLAWGIGDSVPVFRRGNSFYVAPGGAGQEVGRYGDPPLLGGYLSSEQTQRAAGAASVIVRELGDGRMILLMDAVAFRGFWLGSSRLLLNAVAFGGVF
jgi:hypothetical protein